MHSFFSQGLASTELSHLLENIEVELTFKNSGGILPSLVVLQCAAAEPTQRFSVTISCM